MDNSFKEQNIFPEKSDKKEAIRNIDINIINFGDSEIDKHRARKIKEKIDILALPVNNITSVNNFPDLDPEHHLFEAKALFSMVDGEFYILFSSHLYKMLIHEMAHANDPGELENDLNYGGREAREEAKEHVEAIVRQTLKTKKYLSLYHSRIVKKYESGLVDYKELFRETHSILIELRFTNKKHLIAVENAQRKKIRKSSEKNSSFVNLVTKNNSKNIVGVDKTLLALLPNQIKTIADLDEHILKYKKSWDFKDLNNF